MEKSFLDYIIMDEDSVVAYWLEQGCDGFRLDVVDELPNEFVRLLKQRIRQIRPDALLIGEVWEDASNKEAYGERRRYFVDGVLDSCMNYPFRNAIVNFTKGKDDGFGFRNTVLSIAENYPPQVLACNMNLLGTHDTSRILTALVDDYDGSREELARRKLSRNDYDLAQERLQMASFLQYTLPGMPSLYYADETGMQGHKDPFCRRPFPWGREDTELQEHFRRLGQLRSKCEVLRLGDISFFHACDRRLGFQRQLDGKKVHIYANRSRDDWEVPHEGRILLGHKMHTIAPDWMTLSPMGFCIVEVDQ
jgi:glycosidase